MKYLILGLTIVCATTVTTAEEYEVSSKITEVTVYPERALIMRTAETKFDVGTYDLVFSHLPAELIDESVRIKAKKIKLGDVNIKRIFLEKPYEDEIVNLEQKIEELKDKNKALEDEFTVLNAREKFLESIQVASPSTISQELGTGRINPDAWRSGLRFMTSELTQAKKRMREITKDIKERKKKIEVLERELRLIKSKKPLEKKNIIVKASLTKAGTYPIQLTYIVYHVDWKPFYEVRTATVEEVVELTYSAKVAQLTGEDWQGVDLVLSTARPALGAQAPELEPWYVDLAEERMYKKEAKRAGAAQAYDAAALEAEAYEYEAPPSIAVSEDISVAFNIIGEKNIPSTKEPTDILITTESFPAQFNYITIPKLSEQAYLEAHFKNETDYPLLAGIMTIFAGPDYAGKSVLKNTAPGEELELSLGIDERIKVNRELVKKLKSKPGRFGKNKSVEYLYEITVENYTSKACEITVVDQIPVSWHKSLKIKNVQLEPKPDEEEDNGILRWHLTLEPEEKKEISIGFKVEYPEGEIVEGLF